ncbi:hypothetical protein D3C81_1260560 [compost metagenome]
MLGIALCEAVQAQAQLIALGTELDRAIPQQVVRLAVIRLIEFDFNAFGAQRFAADTGELMQPSGNDRVHDKTVIGVVRADRIETQPRAMGIFVETGLTAIVGTVQRLETDQAARGFAHGWRLCGGNAGQSGLAQATELTHAQAQRRVTGQLNRRVAQAHIARNRQTRPGLGQSRGVQTILLQQRLRIRPMTAHGVGEAVNEAHRQVPEAHRQGLHGLQPDVQQTRATGIAIGELLTAAAEETLTGTGLVPELPAQEHTDAGNRSTARWLRGQCQPMPGLSFGDFTGFEADRPRCA